MLRGSKYFHLTLRQAMRRYDTTNQRYIDEIVGITGFDPERTINSLNDKEFEMFWKAIEKVEKWEAGREDFIERWYITGVHKKRGVITEYLINKGGTSDWIYKVEALQLAAEYRLHAIIVHLKNGTNYLRPEYGAKPFTIIV